MTRPADLLISWNPSARASGYEYCIDSNLTNPGCDGEWITTTLTQAIITGLTNNTQYEWQVRAVNAHPEIVESDSGTWWTFSTIPLFIYTPLMVKPGLPSPVLSLVTVPGADSYTLTWNSIAGATRYMIWESTSTTFSEGPTYSPIGTGTSFTLPVRKNPTRYYYYVKAGTPTRVGPKSNTLIVDRQYELEDNDSSTAARWANLLR